MNNSEGLEFIRHYFDEIFTKRNINALDDFLDKDYFDDDIGDPSVDHIQNAKEYLTDVFRTRPTIGVEVKDAMVCDNVISACVEWFVREGEQKRVIRKGMAMFVLTGHRIRKRHTFVYVEE